MRENTRRHRGGRISGRLQAAIVVAVAAATAVTAYAANAGSTTRSSGGPPPVPLTGQHTSGNLLTGSASTFSRSATGWSPSGAVLTWTRRFGHRARGALNIAATRSPGGALSPAFGVRPGARYAAAAWIRSVGARGLAAPALEFFDASGARIDAGTQIGQGLSTRRTWTHLLPAVGFAPSSARTARVVLLGVPGRAVTVDDVSVTETTGTAAPLAGPLSTSNSSILDATGRQVRLRGIQIEGLNSSPVQSTSALTQEISVAHAWGANMIRLPLNADRLRQGSCRYDAGYLDEIRQLVAAATVRGMYTELTLETFTVGACGQWHLPTMPDRQSVGFWTTIASEFRTNPLVGFSLFNEPHDITGRIWRDGGVVTYAGVRYRAVGMQTLYDAVRRTGANNLVFVSGVNWSTDWPFGYSIANARNVVFTPHIYTCPNGLPRPGVICHNVGPHGLDDPSVLLHRFAPVGQLGPVLIDEFGFPDPRDGVFSRNTISGIQSRGWAGWTAFAFDGTTTGMFDLVRNIGPVENPTASGMAAMVGLFAN